MRLPKTLWLALAALLCTFGLLAQYAAPWQHTHAILAAFVLVGCALLLQKSAPWINRRSVVLSVLWGMLLALATMVGSAITTIGTLWPQGNAFALLLRWAGLSLVFAAFAHWLMQPSMAKEKPALSKGQVRLWFFGSWGLIALCFLVYYLAFYPGIFSSDTVTQFAQAYDLADLDNTHSLVHTLLLKLALCIGDGMGIEYRLTYGLLTLFQMIGLAAAMAYAVALLQKLVRCTGLSVFALLNFALNPLHGYYAVTLWKDIPFSAAMLLLTLLLWKAVADRAVLAHWGYRIAFACCLLPLTLFRGNGILVALLTLVALTILWGKGREGRPEEGRAPRTQRTAGAKPGVAEGGTTGRAFFAVMCGIVLLAWGGVQWYCHQQQLASPGIVEMAAVPLQQVARAVSKEEPLTQEQVDAIEYVISIDELKQLYNTRLTDPIKFSPNFYGEAIEEDPEAYRRLWFSILRDFPKTSLEAYLALMAGFYYPDMVPGTTVYYPNESINDWDKEFYNEPVFPGLSAMLRLNPNRLQRELPLFNLPMLPGVLIWVVLLALCCLYAKKQRRLMLVALPALSLWFGLMLGAPVSDARYSYGLFLVLPVMLGLIGQARKARG